MLAEIIVKTPTEKLETLSKSYPEGIPLMQVAISLDITQSKVATILKRMNAQWGKVLLSSQITNFVYEILKPQVKARFGWRASSDEVVKTLAVYKWAVSIDDIRKRLQRTYWFAWSELPIVWWGIIIENPKWFVTNPYTRCNRVRPEYEEIVFQKISEIVASTLNPKEKSKSVTTSQTLERVYRRYFD
jgi:hypothetical protein